MNAISFPLQYTLNSRRIKKQQKIITPLHLLTNKELVKLNHFENYS